MFAIFAFFTIARTVNDGRRLISMIGILLYWSINLYFEVYLVFWVFFGLETKHIDKVSQTSDFDLFVCLFVLSCNFLFCFCLVSKLASNGQKWWRFVFVFDSLDIFIGILIYFYWYASSVNMIYFRNRDYILHTQTSD